MFCHKCGKQAQDGALFCTRCGARLITTKLSSAPIDAEKNTLSHANTQMHFSEMTNMEQRLDSDAPKQIITWLKHPKMSSACAGKSHISLPKRKAVIWLVIAFALILVISKPWESDASKTYGESASNSSIQESQKSYNDIGKTKYCDTNFNQLNITLDYFEFLDSLSDGMIVPESGCVFLRTVFTVENIGTDYGGIPLDLRAYYDGQYEFHQLLYSDGDNLNNIPPLAAPQTGGIVFTVAEQVAKSDKSLVISMTGLLDGKTILFKLR